MSKTRFYHSSPKRFKKGDVLICPASEESRNYSCWGIDGVFLTTSPVPHHTIWPEVLNKKGGVWYVYEVDPCGKLERGIWEDVVAPSATVIRRVGDARGILLNYKKKLKLHPEYGGEKLNEKCYVHHKRWKDMKKKW